MPQCFAPTTCAEKDLHDRQLDGAAVVRDQHAKTDIKGGHYTLSNSAVANLLDTVYLTQGHEDSSQESPGNSTE